MSAVMITLFFGGPAGPWYPGFIPAALMGFIWFFAKLIVFVSVFILLRGTLPRLRYDQLMDLGWKLLIPFSLGWFLILAAIRVGQNEGWNLAIVIPVGIAVMGLGAALLMGAIRNARATRADADFVEEYG